MVIISQFSRPVIGSTFVRIVGLTLILSVLLLLSGCNSSDNSAVDKDHDEAKSSVETQTFVKGREKRKNNEEKKNNNKQAPRYTKNQTILILAAEPDVRAAQLYRFAREYLTPEQIAQAEQISGTYDNEFLILLRERAEILETATDDNNVQGRLNRVYRKTVELSKKIRQEIRQSVLTPEQRKALQANYKEKQEQDPGDAGT